MDGESNQVQRVCLSGSGEGVSGCGAGSRDLS
jgi:hypothetical protein